jgi:hypothetical protein
MVSGLFDLEHFEGAVGAARCRASMRTEKPALEPEKWAEAHAGLQEVDGAGVRRCRSGGCQRLNSATTTNGSAASYSGCEWAAYHQAPSNFRSGILPCNQQYGRPDRAK